MLSTALTALNAGNIVAVATETTYGLAVNAMDDAAVYRLFALKGRPLTKPLTIQVGDVGSIYKYADVVCSREHKIIERYMPGPITLILRKKNCISDVVTAGSAYVGVRIPNHKGMLNILQTAAFPLAVASANHSGQAPAKTISEVRSMFGDAVACYMSNDEVMSDVASTVVQVVDDKLIVLREGVVTLDELHKVLE